MVAPQSPPPLVNPAVAFASPFAVSKATIFLLAANAAYPLARRAFFMVTPRSVGGAGLYSALNALDSLLQLAAVILFLIWSYRVVAAINAASMGPTWYSPGMAVGCWFIPFANFGMPYISARDTWRRTMEGDDRAWVVPLWWFSYLGWMVMRIFFGFLAAGLGRSVGYGAVSALGWLSLGLHVCAFACWALFVHWITERTIRAPIRR